MYDGETKTYLHKQNVQMEASLCSWTSWMNVDAECTARIECVLITETSRRESCTANINKSSPSDRIYKHILIHIDMHSARFWNNLDIVPVPRRGVF